MIRGKNYDGNLTTKEIAKRVREELKKRFPKMKFSVRFESFSGGSAIHVSLMSAPFPAFSPKVSGDAISISAYENQYAQVNQYHIESDDRLTGRARLVMRTVNRLLNSYNYDDSDVMVDYFSVNFYTHLSVGWWERPFVIS